MVTSYVGNNNGKMPATADTIKSTWFNANGEDPDGVKYYAGLKDCANTNTCKNDGSTNPTVVRNGTSTTNPQAWLLTQATCENGNPTYKQGKRNFVIFGYIEDGANTDGTYCLASNA